MSNHITTDVKQPGRRRVVIEIAAREHTPSAEIEFEARVNEQGGYDVSCLYKDSTGWYAVKALEGSDLRQDEVKALWARLKEFYGVDG
jgi:hypothetical protein